MATTSGGCSGGGVGLHGLGSGAVGNALGIGLALEGVVELGSLLGVLGVEFLLGDLGLLGALLGVIGTEERVVQKEVDDQDDGEHHKGERLEAQAHDGADGAGNGPRQAPAAEATAASDLNGKRVLVLCQGGGTSGLLANALAKAAKERSINLETAAEAYGNHVDMLPDFDLVVLAPQAASYLADLQKDCERVGNKCVACRGKQYIELSQNGDKSLAFVSEQLSK